MHFREWNEVEERYKIQEDKCMAILSNGMLKRRFMSNKRCLVSLFHSDILTLAVLEAVSENSLELKSLEQRSILLIDEILLEVGRDITVGILIMRNIVFSATSLNCRNVYLNNDFL